MWSAAFVTTARLPSSIPEEPECTGSCHGRPDPGGCCKRPFWTVFLAEVQGEISREVTARHLHTVQEVLVESINEQDASSVTGRMSNNTLVHFRRCFDDRNAAERFPDECRGFYYMGTLV